MKKEETEGLGNLSRQQLRELEAKDKTTFKQETGNIRWCASCIYRDLCSVFSGCTDKEIEREFADDREAPIPVTASGCTLSLTRRI